MRAMPEVTSRYCQCAKASVSASESAWVFAWVSADSAKTGTSCKARGTTAPWWWPAGSCTVTSFPFLLTKRPLVSVDVAREAIESVAFDVVPNTAGASTASPAKPRSTNAALASVNLHCARITNICRRLSVAGSTSALHSSKISSALFFTTTKLASMRPLAEHQAASRASSRPIKATSCVS